MFGWIFGRKKEISEIKNLMKDSFDRVKEDIDSIGKWIKHFDGKHTHHDSRFSDAHDRLSSVEKGIEEIKNTLSLMDLDVLNSVFKRKKQLFNKQPAVQGVQTPIQTGVQTGENGDFDISSFSVMERALIYILLNTEMKLSYDDLATMMGKRRATVRGQINSIKQKSQGLVEEVIERNGKKRLFIPGHIKEKLLKNVKVSVNKQGKRGKKAE